MEVPLFSDWVSVPDSLYYITVYDSLCHLIQSSSHLRMTQYVLYTDTNCPSSMARMLFSYKYDPLVQLFILLFKRQCSESTHAGTTVICWLCLFTGESTLQLLLYCTIANGLHATATAFNRNLDCRSGFFESEPFGDVNVGHCWPQKNTAMLRPTKYKNRHVEWQPTE